MIEDQAAINEQEIIVSPLDSAEGEIEETKSNGNTPVQSQISFGRKEKTDREFWDATTSVRFSDLIFDLDTNGDRTQPQVIGSQNREVNDGQNRRLIDFLRTLSSHGMFKGELCTGSIVYVDDQFVA